MFTLFEGASLKIAKNLIKVTGVQEAFEIIQQKNLASLGAPELLKQILALNACNLLQTMMEDFVQKDISGEDRQDVVDDYVVENLRQQKRIPIQDGAMLMDLCLEIQSMAEKYQVHWSEERDPDGPGPRFYCVKDLLKRLGNEENSDLQDPLFEFIYEQHHHFIRYFRTLLEPMDQSNNQPQPEEIVIEGPRLTGLPNLSDLGPPPPSPLMENITGEEASL